MRLWLLRFGQRLLFGPMLGLVPLMILRLLLVWQLCMDGLCLVAFITQWRLHALLEPLRLQLFIRLLQLLWLLCQEMFRWPWR